MAESTHRVDIIPVTLEKHPNADSLSIVRVEGYQVVCRTQDWEGVPLGAYVPPDSLVPLDNPRFEFLKDPKKPDQSVARVKAKRLRGEWSMGLLVPAPEGYAEGDDVAALLGVTHYDPPEPSLKTGGEAEKGPRCGKKRIPCPSCAGKGVIDVDDFTSFACATCAGKGYPNDSEAVVFDYPKYDVEAFRKYGRKVFEPGELVYVTEKIHGANGRWLFDGERYYCGSRTEWKRESEDNLWWRALRQYPAITNFLFMNPGTCVYGEVYGQVQDLKYGTQPGEIRVALFDILHKGKWVDARDGQFQPNPAGPPAWTMPWVPLIGVRPFDFDALIAEAEGASRIPGANHLREGIVIKPLTERWHPKCGRVNLKVVSNLYLERA